MQSSPVDLELLIADLRRVQNWLNNSLGVSVDESQPHEELASPFAPPDELTDLKNAIDRVRPLLWIYVTRQNETREANLRKAPAGVRSLMEDALSISDRYMNKE
jgi:hypothetical protein